jgi:hypothetical protein
MITQQISTPQRNRIRSTRVRPEAFRATGAVQPCCVSVFISIPQNYALSLFGTLPGPVARFLRPVLGHLAALRPDAAYGDESRKIAFP